MNSLVELEVLILVKIILKWNIPPRAMVGNRVADWTGLRQLVAAGPSPMLQKGKPWEPTEKSVVVCQ